MSEICCHDNTDPYTLSEDTDITKTILSLNLTEFYSWWQILKGSSCHNNVVYFNPF